MRITGISNQRSGSSIVVKIDAEKQKVTVSDNGNTFTLEGKTLEPYQDSNGGIKRSPIAKAAAGKLGIDNYVKVWSALDKELKRVFKSV